MTWGNPLAWLGAILIALPIVIHLFGRREPRVQRFPTLTFLSETRIPPARRSRIEDPALLAVRATIVLAAVAALAQPLLLTGDRGRALGEQLSRAVVIDTSASMSRSTVDDPSMTGAARARAFAAALPAADRTSTVLTADPGAAVSGAAAWLDTQPGRRELVVISDFQLGALDAADLAGVSAPIGIRVERVALGAGSTMAAPIAGLRQLQATDSTTTAEWERGDAAEPSAWPVILAAAGDAGLVRATRQAARALVVAPAPASLPVVIAHPSHPDHAEIAASLSPVTAPWMASAIARLRADPLLRVGSIDSLPRLIAADSTPSGVVPIIRGNDGRVVALTGRATVAGNESLAIVTFVAPGTMVAARLVAATARAVPSPVDMAEREPAVLPDSAIAAFARDAAPAAGTSDESDGRWLWLIALLLLGLESWMRRR